VTLDVEDIASLQSSSDALFATARAGTMLASLCRGAIRGCDSTTDPGDRVKAMLAKLLEMAGFETTVDIAGPIIENAMPCARLCEGSLDDRLRAWRNTQPDIEHCRVIYDRHSLGMDHGDETGAIGGGETPEEMRAAARELHTLASWFEVKPR